MTPEARLGALATMETQTEIRPPSAAHTDARAGRHHDRGLVVIGGFKLLEAVFFFLVGIGAFHYLHRDLWDAAVQLATKLRMDPDGRLVSWVLDHLDVITAHRLKQI